ncbi:hypothetical protein E3N88_06640 [Mikania micrantha]|uniref:Uncharacterized protein n=1 Tax=Mikania micrantha TaxID=192012 RepID=A0A5N6PP83_9ASTR|nr:hypothetical protein E3N88_06640 [Mikania micrantha]
MADRRSGVPSIFAGAKHGGPSNFFSIPLLFMFLFPYTGRFMSPLMKRTRTDFPSDLAVIHDGAGDGGGCRTPQPVVAGGVLWWKP